jgi:hypothetical protein
MKAPYILDIATTPLPRETLLARAPEFKAGANLKDPAKIAEDIERKKKKYLEDAHLSEATATVSCIAIADYNHPTDSMLLTNDSEKDLLASFEEFITKNEKEKLITFRGFKFVYPFLARRGAVHGFNFFKYLVYPAALQSNPFEQHIDVAKIWACGSIFHPETLQEIADVLGIECSGVSDIYHELVNNTSDSYAFVHMFNKLKIINKIGKALGI